MANQKISDLAALTAPAPTDELEVLDKADTTMASTGTNKRSLLSAVLKGGYKITTITTFTAPTPTGDGWRNVLIATALTDNATIAAPSGTPALGNMLKIVITASGSTRTIGYNAALEAGNITRTTSLPAGSTLTQIYHYANSKWTCLFNEVTT